MPAELCPVCKGSGKLRANSPFDRDLPPVIPGTTCHGCNGKGWVEVGGDENDSLLQPSPLRCVDSVTTDGVMPDYEPADYVQQDGKMWWHR